MEKDNSILIIAVTILVILGGYFYFSKDNKGTNEVLESETATTTEEIISLENLNENKNSNQQKNTVLNSPAAVSPQNTLPTMTQDGVYLVYYLNNGFYPTTLQIKKGSTVRFINNSEKAMRVFSDIQNNILYDELSQNKSVGKGGTYEFMFIEKGVWFYHNFDNQEHKANIVVY